MVRGRAIGAAARAALPGLLALPPRSTSSGDLSSLLSTLLRILLQRLDYTVVRVLASDVDAALEHVIDTMDRVVEHEQRKRAE